MTASNLIQIFRSAPVPMYVQTAPTWNSHEPEDVYAGAESTPEDDDDYGAMDGGVRLSEFRNAAVLNELFGNDLLWNSSRGKWLSLTGTHWAIDSDGYAIRCAEEVARDTVERLINAGIPEKEAKPFARKSETKGPATPCWVSCNRNATARFRKASSTMTCLP